MENYNQIQRQMMSSTHPSQISAGGDEHMYKVIYDTLTQHAFGKEVYGDEVLLEHLRSSIPQMHAALQLRQANDISNNIALDMCFRLLGEKKMKPNDQRRLCFEAALVLLHYPTVHQSGQLMETPEELFVKYPEFVSPSVDDKEAHSLVKFRNFMYVAVQLIQPQNHKNHLLDLVTRLSEGRGVKYITGSGETMATSRRVKIYRKEGCVVATPKNVKTKAEREALAALRGIRDAEDNDFESDEDYQPKKRVGPRPPKNPPKKRHNHRQLDDYDMAPPPPAPPTVKFMRPPTAMLPPEMPRPTMADMYKSLSDVGANQFNIFTEPAVIKPTYNPGILTMNPDPFTALASMKSSKGANSGIDFQVGLDGPPTASLLGLNAGVSYQMSEDDSFRCDRQTSLETVGTNEHRFFRQALVDNPEAFGYDKQNPSRGLSSASLGMIDFGDADMSHDTDAVHSLVMLRAQST
jgi:hypothetical protein